MSINNELIAGAFGPQPEIDGEGGYVRWRPRMVRQSIFYDLETTLSNSGWTGATPTMAVKYPVNVVEFYPEFAIYEQDKVRYNTLALDQGDPGELAEFELGGKFSRDYRFNMALYAESDGIGASLFSDLADRYTGMTDSPFIGLYNFNAATPTLIVRLEVMGFQYLRAPADVAPYEHHLFFAELIVRDYVDQNRVRMPE